MKERGQLQQLYRAKESFVVTLKDETVSIKKGDLVRAGHPSLAARPDLFEPAGRRQEVEMATARPGERR